MKENRTTHSPYFHNGSKSPPNAKSFKGSKFHEGPS